jgi:NADPH-dependent ferric siderophore reductase
MMDNKQPSNHPFSAPAIERVRHELRRRSLMVESVTDITPGMRRIVLKGEDLADFTSLAPDDHIKVIVPGIDGAEKRRDYTPRRYDNAARSLTIDFALHEAGPVTQWAIDARAGTPLEIGGPRGSAVVAAAVKRWLLIGDETALPAIGRRIEESGNDVTIATVVAVADPREQQSFETAATLTTRWVYRPLSDAMNAEPLIAALAGLDIIPQTFVWIAAEASVVRAIRAYLVEERSYPLSWIKASGYWVKGKSDTTEKFD